MKKTNQNKTIQAIAVIILALVVLGGTVNAAWYTFDDCGDVDDVEKWVEQSGSYDGINPVRNQDHIHQGEYSMNLTWNVNQTAADNGRWLNQRNMGDLSAYEHGELRFWAYMDVSLHGTGSDRAFYIALGSDTWDNLIWRYVLTTELSDGWNEVALDFDTATEAGTVDWTAIDNMVITIYQNVSDVQNGSVYIDDIRLYADDPIIVSNHSDYYEVNNNFYRLQVFHTGGVLRKLWHNNDRHNISGVGGSAKQSIYNTEYLNMDTKYSVASGTATNGVTETNLLLNSSEAVVIERYIYEDFTNISNYFHFTNSPYIIIKETRENDALEPHGNSQTYYYINDGLFGTTWPYGIKLSTYNGTINQPASSINLNYPFATAIHQQKVSRFPMWYAYNSSINISVGSFYSGMSNDMWLTSSIMCCGHGTGWTEPQFNWYGMDDERHFTYKSGESRWLETYLYVDSGDITTQHSDDLFNSEYHDNTSAPDIYSAAPFNHSYPGSGVDVTTNALHLSGRYDTLRIIPRGEWRNPMRRGYIYLYYENSSGNYTLGGTHNTFSQFPIQYEKGSEISTGNVTWDFYGFNITWHMTANKSSDTAKVRYTVTPTREVNMTNLYLRWYTGYLSSFGTQVDINDTITDLRYTDELLGEEGYTFIFDSAYTRRESGNGIRNWFVVNNSNENVYAPIILDDCGDEDNVELWVELGGYDSLNPIKNTDYVKQGDYSMNLTWDTEGSASNDARWLYSQSLGDLTAYQNGSMKFWAYIDKSLLGASTSRAFYISLGSDTWNNLLWKYVMISDISDGWNEITLDFDTDSEAGTVNWTAIDRMHIVVYENHSNPQNGSVYIDDIRIQTDNGNSWTIDIEVYPHDGNITSYPQIESATQRKHYFSKYAKTMPGLVNDTFGQIVNKNVIVYNATYNSPNLNLKTYSIGPSAPAYFYTNTSEVKHIKDSDGLFRIYQKWHLEVGSENQTYEVDMPCGSWNSSIPLLNVSDKKTDITQATYNTTQIKINATCTSCEYNLTIQNTPNTAPHQVKDLKVTRNGMEWNDYTLSGSTLTIHGNSDGGEDQYIIQSITGNYNILIYNSTGVKITGTKLFDFHAYNTTQVEVDIPETNCRYAFKNAKIQSNPDWDNCNFNITLPQSRVVHVTSYNAFPYSKQKILAWGAFGLSFLLYLRSRRGRMR